jgi:hypothetical protein
MSIHPPAKAASVGHLARRALQSTGATTAQLREFFRSYRGNLKDFRRPALAPGQAAAPKEVQRLRAHPRPGSLFDQLLIDAAGRLGKPQGSPLWRPLSSTQDVLQRLRHPSRFPRKP